MMKQFYILFFMNFSCMVFGMDRVISSQEGSQPLFVEIVLDPNNHNQLIMKQRTMERHEPFCTELQQSQPLTQGLYMTIHARAMFAFTTSLLFEQLSDARHQGTFFDFVRSQIRLSQEAQS